MAWLAEFALYLDIQEAGENEFRPNMWLVNGTEMWTYGVSHGEGNVTDHCCLCLSVLICKMGT